MHKFGRKFYALSFFIEPALILRILVAAIPASVSIQMFDAVKVVGGI